MNKSVLAGIVLAAGAAMSASAQTVPSYTVETRWVAAPFANGATQVTLTLQGRAIFNGTFPADSGTSGSFVRYGNFGLFALGFGPGGAQQPSTIVRTGNTGGTSLQRGFWGNFQNGVDEEENPTFTGDLRGAAVGDYNSTTFTFRRGFRFFSGTTAALNNATGNGTGGDLANGTFNAAGNLTDFNLLRDDFQAGTMQQRNLTDAGGGPAWQDLYRVVLVDPRGLVAGGADETVTFNGWIRAAGRSAQVGGQWTLTGGDSVQTTASISFGIVPTPGAAAVLGLGGLIAGRRRR